MKKSLFLIAASAFVVSLSGCASVSEAYHPDTASLQSRTADYLGYKPEQIKISDVHRRTNTTYYIADTPKGRYGCHISSGWMDAVTTASMFGTYDTGEQQDHLCNKQ